MISRNIPTLTVIKITKWLMLYMPVVKLFYAENGLENFELLTLHGIYSLVIALVEVPSGFIADKWGRKKSMQMGTLLGVAGFSIYAVSYGFTGFLFAEIALGVGQSFISGADSALLYDSLHQQNKTEKYTKLEGRITAFGNLSESFAGVIVSLLAFTVIRNYYYIQMSIALTGFFTSFLLIEPNHVKKHITNSERLLTLKNNILKNKKLLRYILMSSVLGLASLSMAWFAQIIFYEIELDKNWYGYAWTILNLVVALGSFLAGWVYLKIPSKFLIPAFVLVFSLAFLFSGAWLSTVSLVFIIVFYFVRGIVHPVMKQLINSLCPSDIRASVLSIRSLFIRIVFAIISPVLGYLSDNTGVQIALVISGLLVLAPGMFLLFTLNNKN